MNIPEIRKSLKQLDMMLEHNADSINDLHLFAYRYGCKAGSNVYEFVLEQALLLKGQTLEGLREPKNG